MNFWAVSDLEERQLEEFAQLLKNQSSPPQ